jgi:hypothetical protein
LLHVCARSGPHRNALVSKWPANTLLPRQLLDFAPDRFLYDAGLLTRVRFLIMLDLPNVQDVGQQPLNKPMGGGAIDVDNPATGETLGSVPRPGRTETRAAIEAAARAGD